jgi:hypothetical protein
MNLVFNDILIMEKLKQEKVELKDKGLINIDVLFFDFCKDDLVSEFYYKRFNDTDAKVRWIKHNKSILEKEKDKVAKAVKDGLIPDGNIETIWQFKVDRAKKDQEKMLNIKKELEGRVDEIKKEAIKRLSTYLPDWEAKEAKIIFTFNEEADFCTDEGNIVVDMEGLLFAQDPIEEVKQGITHEIFHLWISEKSKRLSLEQEQKSNQAFKNEVIFRAIDEGLAVLISNGSLEEYHKKQGRDFAEYVEESFKSFNAFLIEKSRKNINKINDQEFKNMGHFYVVGNEIVKAVLRYEGLTSFRELIVELTKDPLVFLRKYKKISQERDDLPKLNY